MYLKIQKVICGNNYIIRNIDQMEKKFKIRNR